MRSCGSKFQSLEAWRENKCALHLKIFGCMADVHVVVSLFIYFSSTDLPSGVVLNHTMHTVSPFQACCLSMAFSDQTSHFKANIIRQVHVVLNEGMRIPPRTHCTDDISDTSLWFKHEKS